MECRLCNKQYIGKAETAFNIRLSNHRKDTLGPKAQTQYYLVDISNNKVTISAAMLNL